MLRKIQLFLKSAFLTAVIVLILSNTHITGVDVTNNINNINEINITVDTKNGHKTISPYIYGINGIVPQVTQKAARSGGNRLTGYNWENNMSSAGSDWQHFNDDLLVSGMTKTEAETPAIVLTSFAKAAVKAGAYSLVTLPMAGYVANDNLKSVTQEETAPSERFAEIIDRKPGELSMTPDLTDGVVYSDELMNFLINTLGDSTTETGIKGYCLDNEPALWSETHARIHPEKVTVDELISRTVSLASVIKDFDPNAEVFGPVLYGFNAYLSLQEADDWQSTYKNKYSWFIDCYLDKMKKAEEETGVRLLDVLDVHYYSEAYSENNHRVSFDGDISRETQYARVQSTRTLYYAGYRENSWIQQWASGFLPVLPKLQKSIEKYYPGTKLSVTEYCFGAENHISGGIAQADALGIFASNDVYLATLWSLTDNRDYAYSAINLYTDYDGKGGSFGDTLVSSSTDNIEASGVYSSIHGGNDGKLHIILINRDLDNINNFNIDISGDTGYKSASVYIIDGSSPKIKSGDKIKDIENNSFAFQMQPMSIAHLILTEQDGDESEEPTNVNDGDTANSTETPPTVDSSEQKKPDNSTAVAIGIGVGAAIICAVGGILFFLTKKKKKQ